MSHLYALGMAGFPLALIAVAVGGEWISPRFGVVLALVSVLILQLVVLGL